VLKRLPLSKIFFILVCVWFVLGYASQQTAAQSNESVVDLSGRTPQQGAIVAAFNENLNLALSTCTPGILTSLVRGLDEAVSFNGVPWCVFQLGLLKAQQIDQTGSPDVSYRIQLKDGGSAGLNGVAFAFTDQILQQRTASGVVFAMDQFEKLTTPNAVYAQSQEAQAYFPGIGFQLLSPIQSFWGWSVTVAYSFMILIILVIAFGLLFQARLDGKDIVQLKNAIPNVVLAMVLIPLSYPLAGLFIDGITLGTNVIHGVLFSPSGIAGEFYREGADSTELANTETECLTNSQTGAPSEDTVQSADGAPYNRCLQNRGLYADDTRLFFLDSRSLMRANFTTDIFVTCQGGEAGSCTDAVTGQGDNPAIGVTTALMSGLNTASDVVGGIINLIFGVITLVVVIKIGWRLLKKFLTLMFLPMFGPFIFATVALPGQGTKGIMENFIKPLGAATAAYVVAYGCLLLTLIFTSPGFVRTIVPGGDEGVVSGVFYAPPILFPSEQISAEQQGTGLGGGLRPEFVFMLLGVGIFLSIPPILDSIDKRLGIKTELPAFLATPLAEFNSAADIGLRQGGAVARRGTGILGGGVRSIVRRGMNSYDPNDPGAATRGERLTGTLSDATNALRTASSSGNWAKRWAASAGAAVLERGGNAALQNLTGKESALGTAAGASEKPFGFSIQFTSDVSGDTVATALQLPIAVIGNNAATGRLISSTISGQLIVKINDGSPTFPGPVQVLNVATGGTISTLEYNGREIPIKLKPATKNPNNEFTAKKEIKFGIEYDISALTGAFPRELLNVYFKTKDDAEVEVFVGNVLGEAAKAKGKLQLAITRQ
jgi:hypothetical protein